MKSLIQAVVVAAALVAPVASFAQQSNAPVTRAQVRAELVQLEQAGYHPGVSDPFYPANIQAAEARFGSLSGKNVLIFSGRGNNGGDGAAIARQLHSKRALVTLLLLGRVSETKGDARTNFDRAAGIASHHQWQRPPSAIGGIVAPGSQHFGRTPESPGSPSRIRKRKHQKGVDPTAYADIGYRRRRLHR